METITLLHTRWPKDEFIYSGGKIIDEVDNLTEEERGALYRSRGRPLTSSANIKRVSGMWGTMAMIVGGPVRAAQFDFPIMGPLAPEERQESLTLNCRPVHLIVKGEIKSKKEFTTVERYRTDSGAVNQWDFGYVRLRARELPYDLRAETGNSVVKTLRPGHDGACIRVFGGETAQQRNILIHEAPHVGWVIGCIGPRPLGDRRAFDNEPRNPSDLAVREIIANLKSRGGKGTLFVLRA
jgi:hypothetical protein